MQVEDLKHEYETQHFGFPPYPNTAGAIIKKGTEGIRDEILKITDKICDKFELYLMRNVLSIPSKVVLPEDRVQQNEIIIATNEKLLDHEIADLQQQIKDVIQAISTHHAESRQLDNLVQDNQTMLNVTNQMENSFNDAGFKLLIEHTNMAASQSRTLLENVKSLEQMYTNSSEGV